LSHSGLPTPRAVEMHSRGWNSSWQCLDDALADKPKTPQAQPVVLGSPASTYVRSARLAFAEKGISYRLEPAAPSDDAVAAIHPFHRIPAYRQGPLRLFESSAIMRYVDATFPGPKLVPDTAVERAQMEQWVSAINSYMYETMVRNYVLQYVFPRGADGKPDRNVIDKALPEIDRQLGLLDRAYGDRDALVGERISIADLLLAPIVFYLHQFPESKELLAKHSNVARAHAAMARRPSFAATMPPMR
jgi:glutathione S-transferase